MKENSSKKDSLIVGQMLNILSKEYPVISKNLSKKFSNKRIPNKNHRKQLKAIDLYKHHPAIFQRISKIMGTSVDYQNYSPRYAQVDWDNQDFELSALYAGSYSSKYEDSIETQNSEFDSIFN